MLVTCSIHATEVGGAQMTPELVHQLSTRYRPRDERILRDVILLLVPSLNPDGMDLVADWYEADARHPLRGHRRRRRSTTPTPATTTTATGSCRPWSRPAWSIAQDPQRLAPAHRLRPAPDACDGPRFVLPPFIDPYDPNVDPLIQTQINALGPTIAADLIAAGKAGVATTIIFDAYSPSRAYQHYHGGVRILSEAASVRIAHADRDQTPSNLRRDARFRSAPARRRIIRALAGGESGGCATSSTTT